MRGSRGSKLTTQSYIAVPMVMLTLALLSSAVALVNQHEVEELTSNGATASPIVRKKITNPVVCSILVVPCFVNLGSFVLYCVF